MRTLVAVSTIALAAIALAVPAEAGGIDIQVQFGPGCLPPPVYVQPARQPVIVRWSDGTSSVVWVPVEPQPQIVVPIQPRWQSQPWGCQPPPPRWVPPPRRDHWGGPPPLRYHDGGGRDSRVRHGGPRRPH